MAQQSTLGDPPVPPSQAPPVSVDDAFAQMTGAPSKKAVGSLGTAPAPPKRITTPPKTSTATPSIDEAFTALKSAATPPTDRKTGQPKVIPPEKQSFWDAIWKGSISPQVMTRALNLGVPTGTPEEFAKQAEKYRSEGRRGMAVQAEVGGFLASGEKAAGSFLSGFTSIGGSALIALPEAEEATPLLRALPRVGPAVANAAAPILRLLSGTSKVTGKLVGTYFTGKAAIVASTPKQPGESSYDAFWRRTMAGSAALGGVSDIHATATQAQNWMLRSYFALGDDLAAKIRPKLNEIDRITKQTSHRTTTIDTETSQHIASLREGLYKQINDIWNTHLASIEPIRSDTEQTVGQANEQASQKVTSLRENAVRQRTEVRNKLNSVLDSIRSQTEQAIADHKGKLTQLQANQMREGARLVTDTYGALDIQRAQIGKRFDDMADNIKTPDPAASEIRGLIEQAFTDHGLDPKSIPSRAIELLKKGTERATAEGQVRLQTPDGGFLDVSASQVKVFTEKPGYRVVGKLKNASDVPWQMQTRIREDLWQAASAEKDSTRKLALEQARDDVTKHQEAIAQKNNQGKLYEQLKKDYTVFKRGIDSDMVHTFLDTLDAEAQHTSNKMAQLMDDPKDPLNRPSAKALKSVLQAAGIDTKPLDEIISEMDAIDTTIAETQRLGALRASEAEKSAGREETDIGKDLQQDLTSAGKSRAESIAEARRLAAFRVSESERLAARKSSDLRRDTELDISETGKRGAERVKEENTRAEQEIAGVKQAPIKGKKTVKDITGKDVEELGGLSTQELNALKIRHLMNNAASGGMVSAAPMMTLYGLTRLIMGSPFGLLMGGYGAGRIGWPRLLENPRVQDYIILESGVTPGSPQSIRLRKGIRALVPIAQKALKTGVPQAAAVKASQGLGEPPQPTR